MVDFADTCFYGRNDEFPGPLPSSTQTNFYYSAHDSLYYDHLLNDVSMFFAAASGESFSLEYEVHGQYASMTEGMGFYGNHPDEGEQPVILARDAIALLDADIDFSNFDTVFLIHAGAGEETDVLNNSPEQIYSTYLGPEDFQRAYEDSVLDQPYIPSADFPEGEGIRHILILPENQFQDAFEGYSGYYGSLGTYCFEVGLRLGMLSLSDFTPSGSPDSQGIGQFGLMGYGLFAAGGFVPPQPCAYNKLLMGWLDPQLIDPVLEETWTLYPSEYPDHPQSSARIDLTGSEYFLLEYRNQDPDGNVIFSFDGDLNGNNVPDFWDASNPPTHWPAGFYDPAEDQREWFTGAEWDFFLSDNSAREDGVKGAGSGIYIWHIDEGVVRQAFGQQRNLFNADPARKSVDLEEADGIQDLDSREPSAWWLGGDDDSYRAEDNDTFSPLSRPDTRTNGSVHSNLVVSAISHVVLDSAWVFNEGTDEEYTGIRYAETMTFECRRDAEDDPAAELQATRDLVGVDMTASHLLVAPLVEDAMVVVAAADSGRIYAFDAQLAEWVDHDADPSTFDPLVVGTDATGDPVSWILPAAAGELDPGLDGLEIILSAPGGVYAFSQDGTPLRTDGGLNNGLLAGFDQVVLPPVMIPSSSGAGAMIVVGTEDPDLEEAPTTLHFLDLDGTEVVDNLLLEGRALAVPVRHPSRSVMFIPIDHLDGTGSLVAVEWSTDGESSILWTAGLAIMPRMHPVLVTADVVLVAGANGSGQSVWITDESPRVEVPWTSNITVEGPLGYGGSLAGDGALGRLAENGVWQTGWPRRPLPEIQAGPTQALQLDQGSQDSYLYTALDGRIYLARGDGTVLDGWPLAGPADLTATPVIYRSDFNELENLVVAGTAHQVQGIDPQEEILLTVPVTRLRSWQVDIGLEGDLTAAMYGGSWERGGPGLPLSDQPSDGATSLETAHVCYPQPLTTDVLRVRGWIESQGSARAFIYNLQGEMVRDSGETTVPGRTPFELEINMSGVASGLYLCKLEAGGATSVKTIAVTR